MSDVLVVGEALIDIVVPPSGEPVEHVGGSPTNVAVGLARLDHATTLATHIGDDDRGRRIHAMLTDEGVALAPGSIAAERTSTATAHIGPTGAATYTFDVDWRLAADLASAGHVHTGSIGAVVEPGGSAVLNLLRRCHETATISYDPNARPSLMGTPQAARARVEEIVALADVVKASDEDVAWLYGADADLVAVLRRWRALGPALVLATRGKDGAVALVGDEVHDVAPRTVAVVDTVGAGDSFMAGLLSGLLDAGLLGGTDARAALAGATWGDLAAAVARAVATSAVTVTRAGSDPPRRAELPSGSDGVR